jgi:hypothetical protein
MYNPDQHYQAYTLHLKDLSDRTVRAASMRLGVLLVTLGTWLVQSAQRDERPA